MMEHAYHVPVLLTETLRLLEPDRGGTFFDGTLGGGGHAEAILDAHPATRVIGVDRDPEALAVARERLSRFAPRVQLVDGDFATVAEELSEPLAGAVLDLGISSHQLDRAERGFSFRPGIPLDMRMAGATADAPTAAQLLNTLPESELADLFYRYGEERRSRRLAAEIVRRRAVRPFATSDDLVAVITRVLGPRVDAKDKARIFQALRIAVNEELDQLRRALPALRDSLQHEGVLAVLAYHSLEDREVKHAFREWSRDCICPPELPVCRCRGRRLGDVLTRRPVTASDEEVSTNPRARSVRLRAWRRAA